MKLKMVDAKDFDGCAETENELNSQNEAGNNPVLEPNIDDMIRIMLSAVYLILFLQLFSIVSVMGLLLCNPFLFQKTSACFLELVVLFFTLAFGIVILKPCRPWNFVLIFCLNIIEAIIILDILSCYKLKSILAAVIVSGTIMAFLTFFAIHTAFDCTSKVLVVSLLFLSVLLNVLSLFCSWRPLDVVAALFSVIALAPYFVRDTQRLIRRRDKDWLNVDSYLSAFAHLNLDVIIFFLTITRIVEVTVHMSHLKTPA